MRILLNGERFEITDGTSLAGLVERLGRDRRAVAVEHNGRIVPRDELGDTAVQEGDRVEVVHFVQGGAPVGDRDGRR